MDDTYHAERKPADFVRFGLAFIGFLLATGGTIVASAAAAIAGVLLMLLAVSCFRVRA